MTDQEIREHVRFREAVARYTCPACRSGGEAEEDVWDTVVRDNVVTWTDGGHCASCHRDVPDAITVPSMMDERRWRALFRAHALGCAWAGTRAHRLVAGEGGAEVPHRPHASPLPPSRSRSGQSITILHQWGGCVT
jgi:hypothetical protein